jgi:hypothetical protein
LGAKVEKEKPVITSTLRTDENTTDARSFKSTLTVAEKKNLVKEIGVLKAETSALGGKNAVIANAEKISSMDITGTDSANGTIAFRVSAEDYETFISLRPYAEYTDGTVVYGDYYTVSSMYYDLGKMDYQKGEMKILMIGSSLNSYYLNELVSIGASEGYYMTVANTYFSGCPAPNMWLWLVNDYSYSKVKGNGTSVDGDIVEFTVRTPDNNHADSKGKLEERTIAEALSYTDWDVISAQDCYSTYRSLNDQQVYRSTMGYLPNVFRYIEINNPDARIYLQQHHSYQVGYRWQNPIYYDKDGNVDQEKSTTWAGYENEPDGRMDTVAKQNEHWARVQSVTEYFSETRGIDLVPCGLAWQNARWKEYDIGGGQTIRVGDILSNKGPDGDGTAGDCIHEGTTGGGQYLTACVWFEVLTGESCLGLEWRPSEYEVREDRVLALQQAAHEAVAHYYGEDFAK